MKVEILRTYLPEETLSTLNVIDDKGNIIFTCKGLEPPDKNNQRKISCILEGVYLVKREETSPGHTYPHFRVYGVPNRSGILWHSGNYYEHTLGCYLPGDSFGDKNGDNVPDVLNSKKTLQKLYDLLPDKFYCTYKKK